MNSGDSLTYILLLAVFALLLLFLKVLRGRKKKFRLEKDSSGLWKYHKESQFEKKGLIKFDDEGDLDKSKEKKDEKVIAVLSFDGDLRGKQHKNFADLVDEVEVNKDSIDEIVVVIESPGGVVPTYGHAFSQMVRLRELGIPLTACVDVVAASGGYLMALPANKIIAAPFAMVGSVGVVAFVPNIRNLLLKNDVQPRTFTAGKYKRTVTLFDEGDEETHAHFQSQLEAIHRQFMEVVREYRPESAQEKIETGEYWTAKESVQLEIGLVDELGTSHQYLLKRNMEKAVVKFSGKKSLFSDGLGRFFSSQVDRVVDSAMAPGNRYRLEM